MFGVMAYALWAMKRSTRNRAQKVHVSVRGESAKANLGGIAAVAVRDHVPYMSLSSLSHGALNHESTQKTRISGFTI